MKKNSIILFILPILVILLFLLTFLENEQHISDTTGISS